MPIRPENLARYPANWPEISARVRARAGNRCEFCGVANGAIGGRLGGIWFHPIPEERMLALVWPKPGTEAWCCRTDERGERVVHRLRIIRIVLTVAHLHHVPEHCDDENLRALCQRCHLVYDQAHHAQTRYSVRREGLAIADLFEPCHVR